ncbi:hypothetical protein [Burkholderia sp. IMCC1007]|uniref:hypothetical protein n=1 Tax=Burkholderia sp. IMCC1007 TaxID=3004104 RepID=UPI0022B3AE18|nr:hypothetical protein [Burkholderia sp. IMCC1007]
MAKKETVSVTQLDLDTHNPRTTPEGNQTDALRSLLAVERDGEKVYELARDICDVSMLDPGDRLFVLPSQEKNRFIVLDGNRRLAALRLLSQPGLIEREDIGLNQSLRNRFKRLQVDHANNWPSNIDVVVFDTREQANRFIRLRHTGENAGAGRSAWSALQIARFDHTGIWQCLSALRDAGELGLDVLNELDRSDFNITSFDRVVSTEEFQRRYGCSIGKNSFSPGDDASRAMKALGKVANDVAIGRVHSRGEFAEAKTMSAYFAEIETFVNGHFPPAAPTSQPGAATSPPIKSPPSTGATTSSTTTWQPKPGAAPSAPPPTATTPTTTISALPIVRKKRASKFLISKTELTTVTNQKCRQILTELKQGVSVQDAPFACALLLRSLQEITAEIYVTTVLNQQKSNRAANLDAAATHLLSHKHATDPGDKIDITSNFRQFRDEYEELCNAAHSKVTDLSPDHLRSTWNNIRGGMDLLWKRIYAAELERSQKMTSQQ